MSKAIRRLGRGLDSLIGNVLAPTSPPPADLPAAPADHDVPAAPVTSGPDGRIPNKNLTYAGPVSTAAPSGVVMIPVERLRPNPLQPRKAIADESIAQLARSIAEQGILQPIIVRAKDGQYQIVAGERRWRAARKAGLSQVPAIVRAATDEEMLEFALIENLQREDLNAIDRAEAYRQYCDRFSLNAEAVSARTGEDRTTVTNYLRLLELPAEVQDLVRGGKLTMGHARCLLGLGDAVKRSELAQGVIRHDWSVRTLEEVVRAQKTRPRPSDDTMTAAERARALHLRDMQRRFEDAVKTKVAIHEGKRRGAGRIVIEYFSLDDFDRIAEKLGVRLD